MAKSLSKETKSVRLQVQVISILVLLFMLSGIFIHFAPARAASAERNASSAYAVNVAQQFFAANLSLDISYEAAPTAIYSVSNSSASAWYKVKIINSPHVKTTSTPALSDPFRSFLGRRLS